MILEWLFGTSLSNEDQNSQPKQDIQQESKTPKKEESRYHNYYQKKKKTEYKACEVRRDPKDTHCIKTKGHIFQMSKPPKDFGFIKAKIPISFDLKSVDVRPAKFKLTAGMIVFVEFNLDSHGKLYTEHIVALRQERLQGKSYSEGVVKFINSRRGFGQIMADVTIYYKMGMIPDAKLHDEVYTHAKIVSQGRLSAISVSRPSSHRARRSSGSPTKNRNSNVSACKARSRSSPNRSPGRREKEKSSHETAAGNIKKVHVPNTVVDLDEPEFALDANRHSKTEIKHADVRDDVDHDVLSGEHLKIDKKDGNHSSHAGFEWRDFSELFSPIVTIQMQVENPTVSSDIVLNVLVETQVGQLWKHYQTGNYKMFVKSISPALKIKIAAENPGASSGAQKKIKMELIVKLWMLMGGNFGTC